MKVSRKKCVVLLVVIGMIFLFATGVFIYMAGERVAAIAAIQNSVERNYEMNFYGPGMNSKHRPRFLPAFIDSHVSDWLDSRYEKTTGSTNLDLVYDNRFISLFAGPIRGIFIMEPDHITGDLGAALLRLPSLQQLIIRADGDIPTEAEWTRLCTRLRLLPELEDLEIDGDSITDATIAKLAGHPRLRTIHFESSQLTPGSLKTLMSFPNLRDLTILTSSHFTPEDVKAFKAALPSVKIEIDP